MPARAAQTANTFDQDGEYWFSDRAKGLCFEILNQPLFLSLRQVSPQKISGRVGLLS
jgi:hypothetical protein